jgi:uncharacterized protein (TIGR03437 family)
LRTVGLLLTISFCLAVAIPSRARAQQSISITFSCIGPDGGSNGGGDIGACSVTPYGSMTVALAVTLVSTNCPSAVLGVQFTLSNASGSFSGRDPGSPYGCEGDAAGTAKITGGTGIFAGASGSVTYHGEDVGTNNGTFDGAGTITVPGPSVSGPGGSGYPAVVCDGPGGSGYPLDLLGNGGDSGVTLQACQGTSTTGATPPLTIPAAGDIGPPPLLFTGGGYPLLAALPTKSGSTTVYMGEPPILTSTTTYVAIVSCGNLPPSTLTVNTCWIVINTPNASTVPANTGAVLPAVVNPQGLQSGLYTADLAITTSTNTVTTHTQSHADSATTVNIPVALLVSSGAPLLFLSQAALQFQSVSGAAGPGSQSVSISDGQGGTVPFSAAASTLTGGKWLSVAQSSSQIQVQTNPAGLAPGAYFGRIDITAASAANSPQAIEVALMVTAASANSSPQVTPSALIFTARAGGTAAPQTVRVSNMSTGVLTITTQAESGKTTWLTASSPTSTLASGASLTESVSVNTSGLTPGIYRGTLSINSAETKSTYPVAIVLIVTPASGTCTPTQLVPVFTNLANNFQITGGLPVGVQASVADDCGSPLNSGAAVAYFPDGDPSVSLTSLGRGVWSGTWLPHNAAGGTATVGVMASSATPGLYGSAAIAGSVLADVKVPVISAGGAVSAASLAANAPLAPGGYISIFGKNLASGSHAADQLPLDTTLGGTQVLLGTELLPLQYAGNGQINAVIPYDIQVNTPQQLLVAENGAYSMPETVLLAPAQPAVFTQNQTGSGAGAIMVVKADGTQFLNTASAPATAGDALVIYCSGLGAVTPAVAAGSAAPSSPLSKTVNDVTVSIGGRNVEPFFAGLTPGYAGLYQVNVIVPAGIATGSDVPVIVSAAGAPSPAVTVAIR